MKKLLEKIYPVILNRETILRPQKNIQELDPYNLSIKFGRTKNYPFLQKPKIKSPGFSLIEVIAATVVLSLLLAGAVYLIGSLALSTQKNKNLIIGTFLGQECLELTRNIRDSAVKQNLPFDCGFETGKRFSITPSPINISTGLPNCKTDLGVTLQEGSGFTVQMAGEASQYQRALTFTQNSPSEWKGTCNISWTERKASKSLEFSQILTDWQ